MKKIIKWIIVIDISILIAIAGAIKVYATNENKENFVTVDSNNVLPGGTANITLNLKNILYTSYNIKLNSDSEISIKDNQQTQIQEKNIENTINNEQANEISNIENVENETPVENTNGKEFTISNLKNMDNLIITFTIPETAKIGSKITITIEITDVNDSKNKMTSQITLNIVDKLDNTTQPGNENNLDSNKTPNKSTNSITGEGISINQQMSSSTIKTTNTTMSTASKTTSNATQTITYNGSSDNYLTSIKINEEEIANFNKTNTTYFKTLTAGTTSADVEYEKSDSNSTVCIYGNTNLKVGINKVLITVTAENGSVKNYRLYINVEK